MGLLSTFLIDSRLRGAINAIFASLLVVVEINFSALASYALAREFSQIYSIFILGEPVYVTSFIGALISKKSGS